MILLLLEINDDTDVRSGHSNEIFTQSIFNKFLFLANQLIILSQSNQLNGCLMNRTADKRIVCIIRSNQG